MILRTVQILVGIILLSCLSVTWTTRSQRDPFRSIDCAIFHPYRCLGQRGGLSSDQIQQGFRP